MVSRNWKRAEQQKRETGTKKQGWRLGPPERNLIRRFPDDKRACGLYKTVMLKCKFSSLSQIFRKS
jgi:hypothetical protein